MLETVYAIFDDQDHCCYLCYAAIDGDDEFYDQYEDMNDDDWEEFLYVE